MEVRIEQRERETYRFPPTRTQCPSLGEVKVRIHEAHPDLPDGQHLQECGLEVEQQELK